MINRCRVAVMSDIHGFSIALDTVMADLRARGPFDHVIVAGDLCEVGPDPAGVLEVIADQSWVVIQGNTDTDIVEAARTGNGSRSLDYAIQAIGADGVAYLADLPFSHRVTPPGQSPGERDLLVVHANPRNQLEKLDPQMSDDELRSTIGNERFAALAFGHIHICYTRELDGALLVDVSAVGNPKDGDLRCKYGLIEWDDGTDRWRAEIVKLPYPLEETAEQILASDLPNPDKVLKKLERASY